MGVIGQFVEVGTEVVADTIIDDEENRRCGRGLVELLGEFVQATSSRKSVGALEVVEFCMPCVFKANG